MLPIFQRQLGQLIMRVRRSRNNHHIHPRILHQLLRAAVGLDARVILLCIILWLGGALDNGIEFQFGDFLDEWDVEGFGAVAIAHDADIPGFGSHFG